MQVRKIGVRFVVCMYFPKGPVGSCEVEFCSDFAVPEINVIHCFQKQGRDLLSC